MKFWSRFCFLILAVSSVSRGQNNSTVQPSKDGATDAAGNSPPLSADKTQNETLGHMMPSPSPQDETSLNNTADLHPEVSTTEEDLLNTWIYYDVDDNGTIGGEVSTSAAQATTTSVSRTTGVTMTTASTSPLPAGKGASSWGYVILVLIIVVIIVLCVILYILRRVSRMYSFDLQRPSPVDRLSEPIGTFEPVYLDDLDRPPPKENTTTDDLSPPPVANGTTLPPEENGSSGENAPQEQPDANGVETSPAGNASPSVGDDPADKRSSLLGSTNLFFDITGEEQQNGNNNNPSVCSSDPFVEINLDDPAWCDQLLTSPEASSSVLPFSPFSFSSSSSSS